LVIAAWRKPFWYNRAAAKFQPVDIRLIVPWPAGGALTAISLKISQHRRAGLPKSIYGINIAGAVHRPTGLNPA